MSNTRKLPHVIHTKKIDKSLPPTNPSSTSAPSCQLLVLFAWPLTSRNWPWSLMRGSLQPLVQLLCSSLPTSGSLPSTSSYRKSAASGTAFTTTSSTEPRKIHNRNSRIVFSLIFIAVALIAPVHEVLHFLGELYSSRVNRDENFDAFATDVFFCSRAVASSLASSSFGELLSMCRIQRARFMLSFILVLVGLVEVVCYWRTDIGTEEWANHGSSNNNNGDVSKSVDPAFAQV